jgi:starch phosphorylase
LASLPEGPHHPRQDFQIVVIGGTPIEVFAALRAPRLRESMARLTPEFSATRCVREYTEKHYVPLAAAYLWRSTEEDGTAKSLLNWRHQLSDHWSKLRFGSIRVETEKEEHRFQVQVYLDEMDPDAVQVELYAEALGDGEPIRHAMVRGEPLIGESGWRYSVSVRANRPAGDFTPRVIPCHPEAFVPLESAQILWYR